MRVIVNIQSLRAAKAFGWRAREIHVNDNSEAALEEVLKTAILKDGSTMQDYIVEGDRLSDDWILYVNGIKMTGTFDPKTRIKDSTQIHLMAAPHPGHA
jgi:hypothetical protein